MKNKARIYSLLGVLGWLTAIAVIVLDKTVLEVPKVLGGLLAGGGAGVGSLFAVNALMTRYYQKNEKARKAAEVEERDERSQAIRGMAAYRALVASTPIFILEWILLLLMDLPLPALLVVAAGYMAHFFVYMRQIARLQKEM